MGRVGVAVEETHGDAFDALPGQPRNKRGERLLVQWRQHLARGVHALGHRQPPTPGHQRSGPVDVHVVLLEAILEGHLEHVAMAFGGDQRGLRAAPLDQRVGGERRAVENDADVVRVCPPLLQNLGKAVHDTFGGLGVGGEDLRGDSPIPGLKNDVRESPADVDR